MNILSYFISPPTKVGFDDILYAITQPNYILINTLPSSDQEYLIQKTISCNLEEKVVNELISSSSSDRDKFIIIIYGRNSVDDTVDKKYYQLCDLGITKTRILTYPGGLFEWCLLQDIHGKDVFPSLGTCSDILKYKPSRVCLPNETRFLLY